MHYSFLSHFNVTFLATISDIKVKKSYSCKDYPKMKQLHIYSEVYIVKVKKL